ncbi:MAG: acetate--CoA ligase family protein, partial [Paracoccaceae bacterium]
ADTQAEFKALVPQGGVLNPIDFTGAALNEPEKMAQIIERTLTCGQFDAHVIYLASLPGSPFTQEACLMIFKDMRAQHPGAHVVLSMLASPEVATEYEALGLPCLRDPAEAVHVMGVLTRFGESFARARTALPTEDMPAGVEDMPLAERRAYNEVEAKQLLAKAGLQIPQEYLATNAQEAVAFANGLNRDVALKIASTGIAHKTEIGGVLLNLRGADAVREGFGTLMKRAKTARPDAQIEGVTVAQMVPEGVEAAIGLSNDPVFGPVVMFGLGGIFVEVLQDVSFRLAPFGKAEARRMIDEIRGRAVLDGVRGRPAVNIDLLAEALSRLSLFGARNAETVESV